MTEKIIIAAVLLLIGTGLGATVEHWRMNGEVQELTGKVNVLEGRNASLEATNKRCGVNVAAVESAVKGVVNNANDLNNKAIAAMNRVAGEADKHQRKAEEVLNRPPVPPAEWCPALQKEATAYATYRRGLRMDMNLKVKP